MRLGAALYYLGEFVSAHKQLRRVSRSTIPSSIFVSFPGSEWKPGWHLGL